MKADEQNKKRRCDANWRGSSWLGQRRDAMAALLAELVAIATENRRERIIALAGRFSRKTVASMRPECRAPGGWRFEEAASDSPVCLLSKLWTWGTRSLPFTDITMLFPRQSIEQFQPFRKDHFMFGRGSCDMKGGMSSTIPHLAESRIDQIYKCC